MNILEAMDDPALFRPWFRPAKTWAAWRGFLAVQFGLSVPEDQKALVLACTGRQSVPEGGFNEAWLVCGRRGGKSRILALIAVFLATFKDWTGHLAPGERGTILILATDRRQARTIMRYVKGLLENVPMLAAKVEKIGAEEIELAGRVNIEISAASFRTVRGYTVIAALCDEIAFWRSDDSANPDREILDALRPAMATVPGSMLLCASSPYARRGALWEAFQRWHGKDDTPALVWRADTKTMNPSVPDRVIAEAYERDPAAAAAEFGAEFRSDVETFVSREVIEAVTVPERFEMPPAAGVAYSAFVDPSGGSADSMTLAIAHREGDRALLDAVREIRPPFSPESAVMELAGLLTRYRLSAVVGDRYAGEWPRERFFAHGIRYELSDRPRSDLYRDLLPMLNSQQVELLDAPRLAAQLCALERRTARGGRDSIDHPPGGHDDLANAVAGALLMCTAKKPQPARWIKVDFIPR